MGFLRLFLFSLAFVAAAALTAPPARSCSADKYGKCGEQPPPTDRYDKPKADKGKKGPAK